MKRSKHTQGIKYINYNTLQLYKSYKKYDMCSMNTNRVEIILLHYTHGSFQNLEKKNKLHATKLS